MSRWLARASPRDAESRAPIEAAQGTVRQPVGPDATLAERVTRCARPRCISAAGGDIHDVPHERDELLARSDTSGMIAERCATTGRCKARCSAPLTKAAARGVHRRDLLPAPLAVVLLGGILAADALHMIAIASAAERMIRLRARSRGVRLAARSQKQAASGTPTGARTESRPTLNGVHALGRRNWLGANVCRARGAHSRDMCSLRNRSPHALHTANVS